jgi:hypothetical protein
MKINFCKKTLAFLTIFLLNGMTYAGSSCSFKIINHGAESFTVRNARATIGNLAVPPCNMNPMHDDVTVKNCANDPDNTLFEYPQEEPTCISTNHQSVLLYFSDLKGNCYSSPQTTVNHDVILNFPEDFTCKNHP